MAQPKREIKNKQKSNVPVSIGTGNGLDYCNECPFLDLNNAFCNTSDKYLKYTDKNKIKVPDWCGNKKRIQ